MIISLHIFPHIVLWQGQKSFKTDIVFSLQLFIDIIFIIIYISKTFPTFSFSYYCPCYMYVIYTDKKEFSNCTCSFSACLLFLAYNFNKWSQIFCLMRFILFMFLTMYACLLIECILFVLYNNINGRVSNLYIPAILNCWRIFVICCRVVFV